MATTPDEDEDYAGEHVLPGASFLVLKDAGGWYWEGGPGSSSRQRHGPFETGLQAYRAALQKYDASFG
jgi:hypothetical protein